tara:strand:+ start:188 stop:1351 length:1164 start_codon:yes stop_codon:yes gene_type:complete
MSEHESQENIPQSGDIEAKLAEITELQEKTTLLKRGLVLGILSILALGVLFVYGNIKREAKPVIDIYKDANATVAEAQQKIENAKIVFNRNQRAVKQLLSLTNNIGNEVKELLAEDTLARWRVLADDFDSDTRDDIIESLEELGKVYADMEPDFQEAYKTLDSLLGNNEEFAAKLRADFESEYESRVKPAAEDLAKKILVDIQGEAGEKFSELATHADEIMAGATGELHALTNGIPDKVKFALDQTLVKTINDRDEKLRKMFPKLTKEKQAALVSRLSSLSKEQSEKIFLNLFADHVSELGKASDALIKIQQTEPDIATTGGKLGDVQTSLALLSAILEIAKGDFKTQIDSEDSKNKSKNSGNSTQKKTSQKGEAKSASKQQVVENN